MSTPNPKLSIVVVNSDGLDDTLNCVESIFANPPALPWELIVVDNCSHVPCLPIISERYPAAQCLLAPQRQGFARNYNLGMRAAHGEYLLILNNDTLVPGGALDLMLATMDAHLEYGMLGPRVLLRDGTTQAECYRSLPTPASYLGDCLVFDDGLPLGMLRKRWRARRAAHAAAGSVACIVGACMLVRASDVAALGALDEGYDFYYEDIEWCHRFWKAGRAIGYEPQATITHLHDQSARRVKIWAKQHEYRGALRYFGQYYTPRWQNLLWLATLWHFFQRGVLMLAIEAFAGRPTHARSYLYLLDWLGDQAASSDP